MTTETATFTVGDTAPNLSGTCTTKVGKVTTGVDLSTATLLTAIVRRQDRTILTRTATKGAELGAWSVAWDPNAASPFTVWGEYTVSIRVTWADGSTETFGPSPFLVKDREDPA